MQRVIQETETRAETTRLHYLDWLRVVAILVVFLYHAVHPFDLTDWHIKNAEQSELLTGFLLFLSPWGMPFFFLIAGTGTWFARRHRDSLHFWMSPAHADHALF
jgi:peptidoglycan/LPS O-acetylase OafA/YrhL